MRQTPRGDESIAADVRNALRWDTRLAADSIQIEVVDGVVTLAGSVRLLAERQLAAADAWRVKGVRQVIDDLAVSPTAARTDTEILSDVENALRHDHRVSLHSMVIQVAAGVVTLSGQVDRAAERRAAEETAWYTPGVIAVVDRLDVAESKRRPESEILAAARDAIVRDARIADATRIEVSVADDRLTLTGTVDHPEERQAAQEDAWFTAGVRSVINQLVVGSLASPS
ncbi:MAG: BON domain-containing protein [Chloroflexota bacterium]